MNGLGLLGNLDVRGSVTVMTLASGNLAENWFVDDPALICDLSSRSNGQDHLASVFALFHIRLCLAGLREWKALVDMRPDPAIRDPLE